MTAALDTLRASYAHACEKRSGQGVAFVRMQDRLHDELQAEVLMRQARSDIELLTKTLKTMRETFAFGEAQS